MVFKGLNGALGLYASVKGMLDSAKAARDAKKLRRKALAEEDGWYKRNYYGNLLGSTASRAAIKRVENTLRRQNQQDRARSVITGATPEYSVAKSGQTLRAMEGVMGNLASAESDRQSRVDALHRQNRNALLNSGLQLSLLMREWLCRLQETGLIYCRMHSLEPNGAGRKMRRKIKMMTKRMRRNNSYG